LLNRPESLKFRGIDDGGMVRWNEYIAVNFIANHTVSGLHNGKPSNHGFIAVLGKSPIIFMPKQ
jgi:hypothetical protein